MKKLKKRTPEERVKADLDSAASLNDKLVKWNEKLEPKCEYKNFNGVFMFIKNIFSALQS